MDKSCDGSCTEKITRTNATVWWLRKKRLVEAIKNGRKWKNYTFDILEVIE